MPANQRSGQLNTSRLLREIWQYQGLSRIDLARRLDLDKSTVTLLVNPLIEQGLLEIQAQGDSGPRGGRRPQALGLRGDFASFLGIEITPGKLHIALVDLVGHLLDKRDIDVDLNTEYWLETLIPVIKEIYQQYHKVYPVLGVGLALPGVVNSAFGELQKSLLMHVVDNLPIGDIFAEELNCDIMVENDANCCTWGELVQQRFSSMDDFLFLLVESDLFQKIGSSGSRFSLGLGIAIDGKVYQGKDFGAGEFRSILWQGDPHSQFSISLEEMKNLARDKELRLRIFKEMAMNIAFIVNTLSLANIFVGGDLLPYWYELLPILEEEIKRNGAYQDRTKIVCESSSMGEYSAAYGAAAMHLHRVFAGDMSSFYQERSQKIGLEALYIK
ncbi:MAG: ROK family transcriptional regulator [Spirochaetaceae bacterium]|nr:ROK family transcriptional regulator [Spirochaetaceae bacterium]